MNSPENKWYGQGDPELAAWAEGIYEPEDAVLREIRVRSIHAGLPAIAVGRFDGLHLEVLAKALGARKAVEIGTLGGYSGVCLLRGMGPEGELHTCELQERNAAVARESFRKAGVEAQAHVHVGPASETLRTLAAGGPYDLVFIDADKVNYPQYLAWAADNLRVGGAVLGDNAFGFGVIHKSAEALRAAGESPEAIEGLRAFSRTLAQGGRFRATMLPTAEGLALGVKIR